MGPSGHFWTISDKNQFFAPKGQNRVGRRCFWAKNHFYVWNGKKGSRRVQKGPKLSKTSRFAISDPFGPLWNVDKPDMFGHLCLFCLCVFFGTPCTLWQDQVRQKWNGNFVLLAKFIYAMKILAQSYKTLTWTMSDSSNLLTFSFSSSFLLISLPSSIKLHNLIFLKIPFPQFPN